MQAENLYVDTIDDLKMLPWFLNHQILPLEKEYHGTQVIAIDSLQGGGLGMTHLPTCRKKTSRQCQMGIGDYRPPNLKGANLEGAILNGADLREATLTDANLAGADLSGAILLQSKGLKRRQVEDACGDTDTMLPEQFGDYVIRRYN